MILARALAKLRLNNWPLVFQTAESLEVLAPRVTEKAGHTSFSPPEYKPLKAVPKHMVVGDLASGIGHFLWSRDHRITRLWRQEWPVKLALVRALPFVTSVTHDG